MKNNAVIDYKNVPPFLRANYDNLGYQPKLAVGAIIRWMVKTSNFDHVPSYTGFRVSYYKLVEIRETLLPVKPKNLMYCFVTCTSTGKEFKRDVVYSAFHFDNFDEDKYIIIKQ